MSLKGANSPTRGGKLRSTGTKAAARVSNGPNSLVELNKQLEVHTRELVEAREQQRATAEILGVISNLPADVQPVFDTIVRNFVLLCGSVFGGIYTFDGELVHFAGAYGFTPEQLAEMKKKYPVRVDDPSVLSSRAILTKAPVHIQDALSDPHYDRQHAALIGSRRLLAVPMLREGGPLGAIVAVVNRDRGRLMMQNQPTCPYRSSGIDPPIIDIDRACLRNSSSGRPPPHSP